MQKQTPSPMRIVSMAVFTLSCFGLLLFLWLSFGGPVPLKAKGYRVEAVVPEATTLAQEADVRLAGVTVGRVKQKELERSGRGTRVTLEIDSAYAPLSRGSRLILRQKTLLGETYVEIAPGDRRRGTLEDGATLGSAQIEPTVELDEIFQAFDADTRAAFQSWIDEAARSVEGGRSRDLNDALGHLAQFLGEGTDVLGALDRQDLALRRTVRNTGVVFEALTRRDGELRSLIQNSQRTFDAFASRDAALAETFRIFPTFLDESRATLARLEGFSREARPVVRELQPVADDLAPTVEDVAALSPDLRGLFRDLDPLISVSRTHLPQLRRFLRESGPVFDGLHPFMQELNPLVSMLNFNQIFLATFLSHGGSALGGSLPPLAAGSRRHYLRAYGPINGRSLSFNSERPIWDRGNAYPSPTNYTRAEGLGIPESFDCAPTGGELKDPVDNGQPGAQHREYPPCFVQGPSLYDGNFFPRVLRGEDRLRPAPQGIEGPRPAFKRDR